MSSILFDSGEITSGDTSEATYTDVVGLASGNVTVDSASDVLLMIASVPLTLAADAGALFRFDVDGTLVGPEMAAFTDATNEGCGASICFATTASAGTHTFGLQWKTMGADVSVVTTVRQMKVLKLPTQV